jgi:hypothetical protein
MYATFPCISTRGCFQDLNPWPHGHKATVLLLHKGLQAQVNLNSWFQISPSVQQLKIFSTYLLSHKHQFISFFCVCASIYENIPLASPIEAHNHYSVLKLRDKTNLLPTKITHSSLWYDPFNRILTFKSDKTKPSWTPSAMIKHYLVFNYLTIRGKVVFQIIWNFVS